MIVRSILENFDPADFDYPNDYWDTVRWLNLSSVGTSGEEWLHISAVKAALEAGRQSYYLRQLADKYYYSDTVTVTDDIAKTMGEFRIQELFDLADQIRSLAANGLSEAAIGRAMSTDLVPAFLHAVRALRHEYNYHSKAKPIMDSIRFLIDGDSHDELGSFLSEIHEYLANLTTV